MEDRTEPDSPIGLSPPPGHRRFPLVDSVRAINVLMVIVAHAALLTGTFATGTGGRLMARMDLAVASFFIISAFLLYRPFVAHRILGAPRIRFRDYARRRVLRILPAFWVALAILGAVPGLLHEVFGTNWWIHWGMLRNFPFYELEPQCVTEPLRCGIPPTWSLAIEIGFYALLPLLVIGLSRIAGNGRGWLWRELAVLATIAVVSVIAQIRGGAILSSDWLLGTPFWFFLWFAVGMGLAVVTVALEAGARAPAPARAAIARPGLLWLVGLVVLTGGALTFLTPISTVTTIQNLAGSDFVPIYLILGLVAFLYVAPAILGDDQGGWPRRLLANPVLSWIGLVSYGIFLWHFPIMIGLTDLGVDDFTSLLVLGFAVSVAFGAASYYVIERPFLRLKDRRSRAPRPAEARA